jgi:hypothetical protein
MAQVRTSFVQIGPKGTSARNSTDPSEEFAKAVTLSISGTCWTAGNFYFSGWAGPRGSFTLPGRPKRLALKGATDEPHDMQKRAKSARASKVSRAKRLLAGMSLVLGATAGGLTVATGLQCSGEAMAQVRTSFVQIGPKGTSARNSSSRTGGCTNRP